MTNLEKIDTSTGITAAAQRARVTIHQIRLHPTAPTSETP
jgi:hypothetical protein